MQPSILTLEPENDINEAIKGLLRPGIAILQLRRFRSIW